MSRTAWLLALLLILLVQGAAPAARGSQAAATLGRGPYLGQVTTSGVTVAWTTAQPGTSQQVAYRAVEGEERLMAATTRRFPAAQTGLPADYYAHRARIEGLAPDTRYTYRLLADRVDLTAGQSWQFRTAPGPYKGQLRFVAFGDSGAGSPAQQRVAGQMLAARPDLLIQTGDLVYDAGRDPEYDPRYFEPNRELIGQAPLYPSLGNHDLVSANGRPYLDNLALPQNLADGSSRYYSFDYGNAHFVALDVADASGRYDRGVERFASGSAQYAWLEQDLAATRRPWKFVYFHYPPYSDGLHGSDPALQQQLAPLFERSGVDLVFAGHDHLYERSQPLRGGAPVAAGERGAVYVVTGGGGAALYPLVRQSAWAAASRVVHHFVQVTIAGPRLTLDAIDDQGRPFDRATIEKPTRVLFNVGPFLAVVFS